MSSHIASPVSNTLAQSDAPAGLAPGAAPPNSTLDRPDLGRSPTVHSEETLGDALPAESTLGKVEHEKAAAGGVVSRKHNVLSGLPNSRKNVLLLSFCLAMFIDAAGVSIPFRVGSNYS